MSMNTSFVRPQCGLRPAVVEGFFVNAAKEMAAGVVMTGPCLVHLDRQACREW